MNEHSGELTASQLHELLSYDPSTGIFRWKCQRGNQRKGSTAGTLHCRGYLQIRINGKIYLAHRLAWLWMTGIWPSFTIDHINGVKTDNRLSNLRDVPHGTNMENVRRAREGNASGLLGVSPSNGRWEAKIQVKGKAKYIGTFDTAEEAHEAYLNMKRELHEGCTL